MAEEAPLEIDCDLHGKGIAAVVCRHLLRDGAPQGFVENSTIPGDLQAWCNKCEDLFIEEGSLTEAFRAFNDMRLVCESCYAVIKERHCV